MNFHANKDTLECLQSLKKLNDEKYKKYIVLVSVEEQENIVELEGLADVVLHTKNTGFSGNHNLGISYAFDQLNCDFVLLLNNDTIVDAGLLSALLTTAQKHTGKLAVFSPKIYFAPGHEYHKTSYESTERGKVLWYAGGCIDFNNAYGTHRGVDEVDHGQFDDISVTEFATGCCMLIPRITYQRVGLLDERYFLYWEDTDYSMRVKKAGGELWYVPNAVVWHKNAGSTGGSGSNMHIYYQTRNRILFSLKHASVRTKVAVLRQAVTMLVKGNGTEKEAVGDALRMRFGKRANMKGTV